jgi:HEAT repeat protein
MKTRLLAGFAAVVICLVTAIIVGRQAPENFAGRNRNSSLEALCSRAYTGDANAAAQVIAYGTNAIPDLRALLYLRDDYYRKLTWQILPKLPLRARRWVASKVSPPIAEYTRETAAHALGLFGPAARAAIPDLMLALPDKEGRVCVEASSALGRIGKDALPALIIALQDSDAQVRYAAVCALSQIGPEIRNALPGLVQKLEDPVERVRNAAAYTLTTIGMPGTLALIDIAEHGNRDARNAASNVLAASSLSLRMAGSGLSLMAQEESPARRERAIRALGHIRVESSLAVDMALHALEDPSASVRLAAIETLGAMGSRSQSGIPQLARLTTADDEFIRVAARRAIANIAGGTGN